MNVETAEQITRHSIGNTPKTARTDTVWASLVAPCNALRESLDSRGVQGLREQLAITSHYPFFQDLLSVVLARLETNDSLHAQELDTRLHAIAEEMFGRMTATDLVATLSPLFEEHRARSGTDRIPAEVLATFFDDIGLGLVSRAVAKYGNDFVQEELKQLLDELLRINAPGYRVSEPLPTTSGLHTDLKSVGVAILPAREKAQSTAKQETERPLIGTVDTGVTPVEAFITTEDREKFIRKLFKDNEQSYEKALALINQAQDWKQASVYVEAVFLKHKIDPFSKRAIKFTDAVYNRHNRRTQQET